MPQPLLTFLVYIPGTSCNYRSLNFIGVLQRANVSMPLHFHMQNATSIHPPAHPRALKALLCVARLLEKSRRAPCEPQARMRGGGKGKEGKGRRGWWWSSSSAVDTLRPLLARLPSCTVGNKLLGSSPPNRAAINGKLSRQIDIPGSQKLHQQPCDDAGCRTLALAHDRHLDRSTL